MNKYTLLDFPSIADIPCMDQVEIEKIKTGDVLSINTDKKIIEIRE